ncbi:MAG: ABC transporter ATP-binding protein [Lachnospiraceae bacterium]
MGVILTCNKLTKNYGRTTALDAVDLTIESGKIVGLLGPNGSGKTTLTKLINGLLTPTSGEVLINNMAPGVETKKIISYLPEKTYLDENMTVRQAIEFFLDFYEDFNQSRAYDMLAKLSILPTQYIKHLSKGTKEKVQLILVMSRRAKLYCLDEPIAGVDPAARDYILSTIINNYDTEATIILSTHLISDVENILDDVVFIQNGKIRLVSEVEDIRSKQGKSVDELFREVFKC